MEICTIFLYGKLARFLVEEPTHQGSKSSTQHLCSYFSGFNLGYSIANRKGIALTEKKESFMMKSAVITQLNIHINEVYALQTQRWLV